MSRNRTWVLPPHVESTHAPEIIEKQPSEKLRLTMDFSAWVFTPEVLSELVISTSEDLVVSGQTIDGYLIRFFIEGGFSIRRYTVACLVESNSREILQGVGILRVAGR